MGSCEKFRTFNFFLCFWLAIVRNLVMADLVSLFEGVCTFFCESFLFYRIFSILRLQLRILDYAIAWIFRFFSSYWSSIWSEEIRTVALERLCKKGRKEFAKITAQLIAWSSFSLKSNNFTHKNSFQQFMISYFS